MDDGNDDNDPRVVLGRTIDIPDLPFTISAWVNPTDYADWRAIVSKRDSPGGIDDMRLDLGLSVEEGQVYLYDGHSPIFFDYAVPVNGWTNLAVVADSSGTRLYVDGTLRDTIGPITMAYNNSANAVIGGNGEGPGGDNDPFKGKIDDLRIYNRALTQAEIQTDMGTPVGDGSPPSAPTGLTATAAGSNHINLSWTASIDNVAVLGYRVERCQGAGCGTFAQIATPIGTSFSDTNLAAATSYSYRVRAADAAGNLSAYSSVASAGTGAGVAQVYYIVPDHLNTPRLIADQAGNTVWRNDNTEPFGDSVPNDNPSGLGTFDFPLRFPGQYFDRETDLFYNYHRNYSSRIARYVEADPIGIRGALNVYSYVGGQPLTGADPLGLFLLLDFLPPSHPLLPNGNLWPGAPRQNFICDIPFTFLENNPCTARCCVSHDDCYRRNSCNFSSWFGTVVGYALPCNRCNIEVGKCVWDNWGKTSCPPNCGAGST